MTALAALALFACFAWPQREVITGNGATTEIWSFGAPKPWLKEIRVFQRGGGQNWPERTLASASFVAGIVGMGLWFALGKLAGTESLGAALVGRASSESTLARPRWWRVPLVLLLGGAALAHGGLLMCAMIPAPALGTMAMSLMGLPFMLVGMRLARQRYAEATPTRAGIPQAAPANPWPRRVFWVIVGLGLIPAVLLLIRQ